MVVLRVATSVTSGEYRFRFARLLLSSMLISRPLI
jgi:hypothetical protein